MCENLYADLLHEEWERRHGAARALRVLISHHPLLPCENGTVRESHARTRRAGQEGQEEEGCVDRGTGRVRRGETRVFVAECATQLLRVLAFDRFIVDA